MAKAIGVWILGDKLKDLIYTVKNVDGTNRDLTGHTVKLQGRRYRDAATLAIDISGTVAPDQVIDRGKVTFSDITAGLSLEGQRQQTFECRVKVTLTAGSLPGYTNPFDIGVEAWP